MILLHYSYQYNLKIVGVPQINENESAQDTANLYLKQFSALGNYISVLTLTLYIGFHNATQRNNS